MTVDLNGKIDYVNTNLNTKFETLSTHVGVKIGHDGINV